ncbi:MAG: hypothetical protein M1818_000064 [Claussenomyces sp. TS43310]|nr:MAG: hypothetical protein M1818_000064 [Claussenomyces sp. TS43310]
MALTIALDLSLNKLIIPSPSIPYGAIPDNILKSDCITARKALDLDGLHDVDPSSDWGKRLLRRKERIWLALFVLDRGVCLARGRSFTVPVTPLIEICDRWHNSNLAEVWDTSITSSAVLRRDLAMLITDIKRTCDGDRARVVGGSTMAQSLQSMIESFFDRWYATWTYNIEGSSQHHLPPYVDILVTHTRLSTYSSVINHPTAPVEVKQFFRAAGLSSSLNVMRAAVQGEKQLKSMPNNTAIMISFAACFALYLTAAGSSMSLTPSIRRLIEETADVLERIGATPSHRKGTSALFGRHLREVVRNSFCAPQAQSRHDARGQSQGSSIPVQDMNVYGQEQQQLLPPGHPNAFFQPLQFSAMSDYQIIEAINNAGGELDTFSNFEAHDRTGLDWLDWFNLDPGHTMPRTSKWMAEEEEKEGREKGIQGTSGFSANR